MLKPKRAASSRQRATGSIQQSASSQHVWQSVTGSAESDSCGCWFTWVQSAAVNRPKRLALTIKLLMCGALTWRCESPFGMCERHSRQELPQQTHPSSELGNRKSSAASCGACHALLVIGWLILMFGCQFIFFCYYIWILDGDAFQRFMCALTTIWALYIIKLRRWRRLFIGYMLVYFCVASWMAYYAVGGFLWPFTPAVDASCQINIPAPDRRHRDNHTRVVIVGNGPRFDHTNSCDLL